MNLTPTTNTTIWLFSSPSFVNFGFGVILPWSPMSPHGKKAHLKYGQNVCHRQNSPQVWAWKCGFLGQRSDRSLHNLLLREPEEAIDIDRQWFQDRRSSILTKGRFTIPMKIFKIEKLESYSTPKAPTQDQQSRSLSSPAKVWSCDCRKLAGVGAAPCDAY